MFKQKTIKMLLFVFLLMTVSACQSTTSTGKTELPNIGTIKIGALPSTRAAALYVAADKGYFSKQGVTVEVLPFKNSPAALTALGTGEIDVTAGSSAAAMMNVMAKDINIKITGGLIGQDDASLIVRKSLADSGEVAKVADLAGRNIGIVSVKSISEYQMHDTLKTDNLTIDDVKLVVLPFPDIVVALSNGAVDAAMLPEPFSSKAINENIGTLLASERNMDTQIYQLIFGSRLLDPANHEIAVRFTLAYLKGMRDLQENGANETNAAIISKYTQVPAAAIQKLPLVGLSPNGELNQANLDDQMRYYVERGYTDIKEPMPIDNFLDLSFLQEALKRIGEAKK